MKPRAHRRPPLPHWNSQTGTCRWCGEGCGALRRWHDACVTAYKIACWPEVAREHVWAKDKGFCRGCGRDVAELIRLSRPEWKMTAAGYREHYYRGHGRIWQADHIIPLVEANRADLSLWSLTNLRLLCTACHRGETKALAGRRATARKANVPTLP